MKINEIKVGWGNALYLISYVYDDTGEVGLDYTTSLIEFKALLEYHETNTSAYQVFKVVRTKDEE
jgi:hypothetical protein